jgi:hypothetical protein
MDEAQAGLHFLQGAGRKKMVGRASDPEARMAAQADPSSQRALQGLLEKAGDGRDGGLHEGYSSRIGTVFAIFSASSY